MYTVEQFYKSEAFYVMKKIIAFTTYTKDFNEKCKPTLMEQS